MNELEKFEKAPKKSDKIRVIEQIATSKSDNSWNLLIKLANREYPFEEGYLINEAACSCLSSFVNSGSKSFSDYLSLLETDNGTFRYFVIEYMAWIENKEIILKWFFNNISQNKLKHEELAFISRFGTYKMLELLTELKSASNNEYSVSAQKAHELKVAILKKELDAANRTIFYSEKSDNIFMSILRKLVPWA
jgi:hypothetical protein